MGLQGSTAAVYALLVNSKHFQGCEKKKKQLIDVIIIVMQYGEKMQK
jgi:hypothetical protein